MSVRAISFALALVAATAAGGTAAAQRVAPAPRVAESAAEPPADPLPTRASLRHVPPGEIEPGAELRLVAIIDDAWVEEGLVVRYRAAGRGGRWSTAPFERSTAGGHYATIP